MKKNDDKAIGENITPFRKVENEINEGAVEMIENLLRRLKSGKCVAVAFVDVARGGTVRTGYSGGTASFHNLNSGAALLANRLACDPGDRVPPEEKEED